MAIIKAKARQDAAVSRVSEGNDVFLRAMRDGSLIKADWKQALIMEGRGFTINVGSLSSPAVGGGSGATIIENNGPECAIGFPSGTSIMPIYVDISMLVTAGTLDDDEIDILLAVDQDKNNGPAAGTGSTT